MNPGRLNILAVLLSQQGSKSDIGSVINDWAELEKIYVGRTQSGGGPLNVSSRDANSIESVFQTRLRPNIKTGLKLRAEGLTYDINRVDPVGLDRCYIYCKVAK